MHDYVPVFAEHIEDRALDPVGVHVSLLHRQVARYDQVQIDVSHGSR